MKPQVTETYQREGVYATIRGYSVYQVRPESMETDRYILQGPAHQSTHDGYYPAVKLGVELASKKIEKSA